jgi:acid stress chaperone HdeB
MHKLLPVSLIAAIVFLTVPASAAVLDLSTQTCQQFVKSDKDEIGVILAWLNGYYKDEKDPPIIDTDKFVADSKKLAEYCVANPSHGLITAADKVFGK